MSESGRAGPRPSGIRGAQARPAGGHGIVAQLSTALRTRNPLPPLCPAAAWQREVSRQVAAADLAPALASALLLWNDDLDASHTLSQGLPDRFGSWLHGAMHRREGDFANSKYWFRRVGSHPGFATLAQRAAEVVAATAGEVKPAVAALAERWDPFAFVDLCAAGVAGRAAGSAALLEQLQAAELELLTELAADLQIPVGSKSPPA